MRIEAREDAIHIILDLEEAGLIEIDHGEGEVCIPVTDTFEIPAKLGAALRAASAAGEGR